MAEVKKVHKYPTGTIREWEKGAVIKAHDNSIFDSGWMLIPDTPQWLLDLMLKMDLLGRNIIDYKIPIDGELWLKKIINDFQAPSGQKYTLEEFQQYKGLFGAGAYSFRNVFSKRYFAEKIDLKEKINNALIEENEQYWRSLRDEDPDKYFNFDDRNIYLSKDRIKQIKEQVKAFYKAEISGLDPRDIKALGELLTQVNDYLKKGTNFEGDEKEVYDRNLKVKESFLDEYLPLKTKRAIMANAIEEINEKFGDNWGVKESFRKQFQEQFDRYIHKNLEKIKKDELANFQAELGCDISAPIDVFYKNMNRLSAKYAVDLNDYIGKKVPDPDDKYQDVTLLSVNPLSYQKSNGVIEKGWYTKGDEKIIARMIASREVGDMQLPLQIRFDQLYNKKIEGKWDFDQATALKAMEQVFNYLPPGHCLTNSYLNTFSNNLSSSQGYACYEPAKSTIQLSDNALNTASRMASLNSGDEFASVIIHEIGHAVEKKVGLRASLAYKKFGYQAGWNWDLYRGRSVHATGSDKDVLRNSAHAGDKLITKYAQKSPSEAFAEYYSFYSQYKNELDQFLDHKDTKGLQKHVAVDIPNSELHGEKLNYVDFINSSNNGNNHKFDDMTAVLLANKRDLSEHFKSDIIDPWEATKSDTLQSTLDRAMLRKVLELNRNQKQSIPVFSVKDNNGKHMLSDTVELHVNEANKYLKTYTPTYTCTHEAYTLLKQKGYSDKEVADFTLDQVKNVQVPYIDKEKGVATTKGLRYRSEVVPFQTLIKNEEIFREMRNIYYSEELKKALDDLLNDDNDNNQDVEKSDSNETILLPTDKSVTKRSIVELFKKHIVNPIAKSLGGLIGPADLAESLIGPIIKMDNTKKKEFADAIILDESGRLLLLKRCQDDAFMPEKWCLPGGNKEANETGEITAKRELQEETNVESDLQFVCQHETDNALIHYYFGRSPLNPNVIIDSSEHCNYAWVNLNELDQYDLILDLGTKLNEIFDLTSMPAQITTPESETFTDIQPITFEKAFEEITKSYDEGLLPDELYFDALKKYEVIKAINLPLDEKLEKGLISEEDFFKAIKNGDVKPPVDNNEEDNDPTDQDQGDDNGDPNDDSADSGDNEDVHGKTGVSYDKLRQYAMTTPEEQLESFIKNSKDPELRKIAHDELARRQADEHPQEDNGDDKPQDKKPTKQSGGNDKPASKPTNAKEALEANDKASKPADPNQEADEPEAPAIHSDPEYSDKATQYAEAISNGEDPSQNPFLADFANHIEEKKKDFKPLDITVDVPDENDIPDEKTTVNKKTENKK